MDLRKKPDARKEPDSNGYKVKTEYIEEDIGNVMKDEDQTLSGLPDIPVPRYLDQHSSQTHEGGHLFSPFAHPFYHPISAFSFVSLPPPLPTPVSYPAFRDVLESNQNESCNYKRKSPSSLQDNNKKLKEKSSESISQEKLGKEKETKPEESSGNIESNFQSRKGLQRQRCPLVHLFVCHASL